MDRWNWGIAALLIMALGGCGRARLVDDPLPDAGDDAGVFFDAIRFDAIRLDATPGTDGGAASLGSALRCDLDFEQATSAALRYVDCSGDSTFIQVIEAYEANLFAAADPGLLNIPTGNCEYWRCVAAANSCAAFNRCSDACFEFEPPRCEGNVLVACPGGSTYHRVDCSEFGASCEGEQCVGPDGCEFRLNGEALSCGGDRLALCEGAIGVDCPTFNGESCDRFAVTGEVTVGWCGPPAAGAYDRPNACEGRLLRATLASGREVRIDCRDVGYSSCFERGCR